MEPRGDAAAAPRRGAMSRAVQTVYEDFRPVSDWQQDDESHILKIHLPGFFAEQIRVSVEGSNTIRVQGERQITGNKWNLFLEDYQVPDNGDMSSVRAKFQAHFVGILTITVPKVKVDAPKAGVDDIQKHAAPHKDEERVLSDASTSHTTDEKGKEPQNSSKSPVIEQHPGGEEKGQDKRFPADGVSQLIGEKNIDLNKKSWTDHRGEHDQDGDQRGKSFTPLEGTTDSHDTLKKESAEPKEKHIVSQRPQFNDTNKTTVAKEDKESMTGKELIDVERDRKANLETDKTTRIPEKKAESKPQRASPKEKYKAMKGLLSLMKRGNYW